MQRKTPHRVALIEAGSPGLNIYSHVAMGRGTPLLATVVRDAGYTTKAFVEDVSGVGTIDWEWVAESDVVGFSAITCTLPRSAELLSHLRSVAPRATIVFGGPEPTCRPERSLDLGVDFVVRGEAEKSLPRLLAILSGRSDESLDDIEGLVWREAGETREGPPARQLTAAELDALPPVDRSLVHLADRATVASVWRARGCPSRCDFCEVCEIWPRYTVRSDDRSLVELRQAEQGGFGTAFLIDDNAAANKRAFKQFLREVAAGGYLGMLVTQLRADSAYTAEGRIDRELLRLLKRAAAVTVVCVGVESADDESLARLNKGDESGRVSRALSAMRRYGLLVHGMFIALESDTRQIVRRNGSFARRHVSSLQYLFETPLPGTVRTAEHERAGRIMFESLEDLALYDGMHVVIRPSSMSASEMQQRVLQEYRRFYSRGRIVASALRGTFARFRTLTAEQRRALSSARGLAKLRRWLRFHIQYKFAPVSLLAVGRRRVAAVLAQPEYERYLRRLREP